MCSCTVFDTTQAIPQWRCAIKLALLVVVFIEFGGPDRVVVKETP